jgi:hypothetical protein
LSSPAEHDGRLADLTASIAAFDAAVAEGAAATVNASSTIVGADARSSSGQVAESGRIR